MARVDHLGQPGEQGAVELRWSAAAVAVASAMPSPSTKRVTLSSLRARRRPTFIWPASAAVSTPGAELHDQ